METSDCIIKGLYLGGVMAALNEKDLQINKITHILSMDEKPLPEILTSKFCYRHVFALDLYDFDLLSLLPECLDFIHQAREADGAVLVHCQAGISRSATVVVAYLMQTLQLTKDKAIEFVSTVRQFVRPNDGFQQQLQLFENMGCQIDKKHPEFRAFQLSKLAVKFKCGQFAEGVPDSEIPAEVFVHPDYSAKGNDALYKCRKCRTFLFHDGALSSHNIGEGDSAFDWRSKVPANKRSHNSSSLDEVICQRSLFVDPLAWMKGKILAVQGKLHCPKCDTKIGSYVWYGEKCPCGAWVAPAFHISSGKVDKIPSQPVLPRTHTPAPSDSAAALSTSPLQPQHQIGAVAAFLGPTRGGGRTPGHLPLSERSAARLSSPQPVAAVQPRVMSQAATSAASVDAPTSSNSAEFASSSTVPSTTETNPVNLQNMDVEMGNDEDQQIGPGEGEELQIRPASDNRDLESGINSIHMDVDSG